MTAPAPQRAGVEEERWTVIGDDPANLHVVEAARQHMRVCFLTSNGDTERRAQLLAAAPDLLEAAKEALVQAEGCWREHYGEDPEAAECPTPRHIALLRDAIEKATAQRSGRRG